jgi:hypothetical protein
MQPHWVADNVNAEMERLYQLGFDHAKNATQDIIAELSLRIDAPS